MRIDHEVITSIGGHFNTRNDDILSPHCRRDKGKGHAHSLSVTDVGPAPRTATHPPLLRTVTEHMKPPQDSLQRSHQLKATSRASGKRQRNDEDTYNPCYSIDTDDEGLTLGHIWAGVSSSLYLKSYVHY